jgi:hypothetical protein
MSKTIVIKLTQGGEGLGPFNLYDISGNIIEANIPFSDLKAGRAFVVDDSLTSVVLESIGKCKFKVTKLLESVTIDEYRNTEYQVTYQGCSWRHLTDVENYNKFYGVIEPYIIEHPFSYQFQDEILQNVQDYTKVYQYTKDPTGVFTASLKVQPNNKWFNKAILYNDQQSTGLLELEPKPVNNLQAYNAYPKYTAESKIITYTKSDNFYQYNNFWNVAKDPLQFIFVPSCASLSIDKVLNQANMDYSTRSFKKAPLRAKDLKIRHILDNTSAIHLVSQFLLAPAQNSYK